MTDKLKNARDIISQETIRQFRMPKGVLFPDDFDSVVQPYLDDGGRFAG